MSIVRWSNHCTSNGVHLVCIQWLGIVLNETSTSFRHTLKSSLLHQSRTCRPSTRRDDRDSFSETVVQRQRQESKMLFHRPLCWSTVRIQDLLNLAPALGVDRSSQYSRSNLPTCQEIVLRLISLVFHRRQGLDRKHAPTALGLLDSVVLLNLHHWHLLFQRRWHGTNQRYMDEESTLNMRGLTRR